MSQPGSERTLSLDDYNFSVDLLRRGETPQSVQSKLRERGLSDAIVMRLFRESFSDVVFDEAVDLMNQGHSSRQVKRNLIEKGWTPQFVSPIVSKAWAHYRAAHPPAWTRLLGLLKRSPRTRQTAAKRTDLFMVALGGIFIVAGLGLFIGNTTGLFPTFPFAGFIVIGIGGLILRAEAASKSS